MFIIQSSSRFRGRGNLEFVMVSHNTDAKFISIAGYQLPNVCIAIYKLQTRVKRVVSKNNTMFNTK